MFSMSVQSLSMLWIALFLFSLPFAVLRVDLVNEILLQIFGFHLHHTLV